MNQIEQLRTRLADIRKRVNDGEIYQSMGEEISDVIKSIKKIKSTKVYLPDDDDAALETIQDIRTQYYDGKISDISDENLLVLLTHIGSPNLEVRDHGVYFLVNELMEAQVFTKRQLTLAFNYLISDEVLFDHILEPQNNAVYQRSFAVLITSTLLYGDQAGYFFLDKNMISRVIDQIALYTIMETDVRGFIKKNGWGHTVTHITNVIDELSRRDDISRADKLFLMTILLERYQSWTGAIVFGEPGRIASYLSRITHKNSLYEDYFLLQLKAERSEMMGKPQPSSEDEWNQFMNNTRLMQAILVNGNFSDDIKKYVASGQAFFG